ncbi:MAG: FtsX-like permease family protein [Kofleriaceae bacterium]|nr:FtsX-like permease family protein [Kofleriaceae bacterium]
MFIALIRRIASSLPVFVAWRYIRAREMKVSVVATVVAVLGLFVYAGSRVMEQAMFAEFDWIHKTPVPAALRSTMWAGLAIALVAALVRVSLPPARRSPVLSAIVVYALLFAGIVYAIGDYTTRGVPSPSYGVAHKNNAIMRLAQYWFIVVGPVLLGIAVVLFWRLQKPWLRVSSRAIAVMAAILCVVLVVLRLQWLGGLQTKLLDDANVANFWGNVIRYTEIGAIALAAQALYFGFLRLFLSFFTTVSVGGVWIGTGALVCVLSVMGGFEADLREKILGSNAHIQVTKEDGDFTEWADVRAKINGIAGVKASTPFAVSEVVLASNDNGMNVIIKGIDPTTVGQVTDLINNLEGTPVEDREAMQRLYPLVGDEGKLNVPQPSQPGAGQAPSNVIDKAPDDMPQGADPVDLSTPPLPAHAGSNSESNLGEPAPGAARTADAEPDHFGGDAAPLLGDAGPLTIDAADSAVTAGAVAAVDQAPADYVGNAEPPQDFSAPLDGEGLAPQLDATGATATTEGVDAAQPDEHGVVRTITIPLEDGPQLSRRTQTLPGIFVGRELVKQTHLYVGKEVRIVSPLSDPSNPDATGTPIPFNRDYRVAGVFFTGMYEYDLKYVYVTLDSFQEFLDRGDSIDGIEVRVGDPEDTTEYVERISKVLGPDYRVVDWKELNRSLFSALKLEKIAMFLVLGIVILVASFSIVGNLIMVVVEKGREIALLKTLGATDRAIQWLFLIQGLFIGTIGTVLGVGMGLGLCWYANSAGAPLNAEVYYIDKVPIHVDPISVAFIALAGIAISIAATRYPAYLASKVRPAYGLKHI